MIDWVLIAALLAAGPQPKGGPAAASGTRPPAAPGAASGTRPPAAPGAASGTPPPAAPGIASGTPPPAAPDADATTPRPERVPPAQPVTSTAFSFPYVYTERFAARGDVPATALLKVQDRGVTAYVRTARGDDSYGSTDLKLDVKTN